MSKLPPSVESTLARYLDRLALAQVPPADRDFAEAFMRDSVAGQDLPEGELVKTLDAAWRFVRDAHVRQGRKV